MSKIILKIVDEGDGYRTSVTEDLDSLLDALYSALGGEEGVHLLSAMTTVTATCLAHLPVAARAKGLDMFREQVVNIAGQIEGNKPPKANYN